MGTYTLGISYPWYLMNNEIVLCRPGRMKHADVFYICWVWCGASNRPKKHVAKFKSGWWFSHPSEKYGTSIGMISNPIFMGKCQIDGNQTTNQKWRDEAKFKRGLFTNDELDRINKNDCITKLGMAWNSHQPEDKISTNSQMDEEGDVWWQNNIDNIPCRGQFGQFAIRKWMKMVLSLRMHML